jgi:hypothetical protein
MAFGRMAQGKSQGAEAPLTLALTGGRSRIRTWEGEADGFTDRSRRTIGVAADLQGLPKTSREYLVLSAICPCQNWCSARDQRTATDSVRAPGSTSRERFVACPAMTGVIDPKGLALSRIRSELTGRAVAEG